MELISHEMIGVSFEAKMRITLDVAMDNVFMEGIPVTRDEFAAIVGTRMLDIFDEIKASPK